MSKSFKALYSELFGNIPKLPLDLSKTYINQAFQDVRDSKLWGFLQEEGILYSPNLISTGTIQVTQFSKNFQASASAIVALNSLTNPVITKRQIRLSNGPLYTIATYNSGTGAGTFDKIYRGSTSAGISYQLYRAYYGLPEDGSGNEVTDFVRYNKIYNPAINDYFRGINQNINILDQLDPARNQVGGNPTSLFIRDAINNIPQFEMHPHPTTSTTFIVNYQRKGIDLSADSDTLPFVIPDRLVMEKALYLGCLWAAKNVGRYIELKGVNWQTLAQQHNKAYSNIDQRNPGMLEIAQRNDEELNPQSVIVDDYYGISVGDDSKTGYYSIDPT